MKKLRFLSYVLVVSTFLTLHSTFFAVFSQENYEENYGTSYDPMPAWSKEINDKLVSIYFPPKPSILFSHTPKNWWELYESGNLLLQHATLAPDGSIILNYDYYVRLLNIDPQYTGDNTAFSSDAICVLNTMFANFSRSRPYRYVVPSSPLNIHDIPLDRSIYRALFESMIGRDYYSASSTTTFQGLRTMPTYERFLPERLLWWFLKGYNNGIYCIKNLIDALRNLKPETDEQRAEIECNILILKRFTTPQVL